ncbi:hypothetical protein MOF52_01205, partial [Bacillus inaquosorum]
MTVLNCLQALKPYTHVDHGKTTLTAAITTVLHKKSG